jgi:hemerythrin-like domain-containing protein
MSVTQQPAPPTLEISHRCVERWLREHGSISRLLALLESQLAALQAGEDTDDELMLDVMAYLTDFVDAYHQALEDVALEAATSKSQRLGAVQHELAEQHMRIHEIGGVLQEALQRALLDEPVRKQDLARTGFAYTAEMRSNMRLEESSVFPMLEQTVDDATWASLETKLGEHPDPLLGEGVPDRYATLFRELTRRFGAE